jgi:hypothetical protein
MIIEALSQLANVFRRRFLFNALLPTLVFATLTIAVVIQRSWSLTRLGHWWDHTDPLSKALIALAYLALMWFLAGAVASQWRGIVRLFEGYLLREVCERFGWSTPGVSWHQRQMRRLRGIGVEANAYRAYDSYPLRRHEADVLPTRLGNILLTSERYSLDRYGMDSIIFWPRLYPLLPQPFQIDYEEFVMEQEFPLVVAFEASVAAIVCAAAVLVSGGSPEFFAACFGGGLGIAFAFYYLSLAGAQELGEQQKAAVDLYRDRLLDVWPAVADVGDERRAFAEIEKFVVFNTRPQWGVPQEAHLKRRRHSNSNSAGGTDSD